MRTNSIATTVSKNLTEDKELRLYSDADGLYIASLFWDHQTHQLYMLLEADVALVTVLGSEKSLWDFKPIDFFNVEKGARIDLSPPVSDLLNAHYWLNNCSITVENPATPLSFDGNITKVNAQCWQILSTAINIPADA